MKKKPQSTILGQKLLASIDEAIELERSNGKKPKRPVRSSKKFVIARDVYALGELLGLTIGQTTLTKYKSELWSLTVRVLEKSTYSMKQLSKRSRVDQKTIQGVKDRGIVRVSCDTLVKIIGATGMKLSPPRLLKK